MSIKLSVTGCFVAASIVIFCSVATATVYKYTDVDGTVVFVDDLGKIPQRYRSTVISDFSSPSVQTIGGGETPPAAKRASKKNIETQVSKKKERFQGTVELYMREGCPYSDQAEQRLKMRSANYVKYDIRKDAIASSRFESLGGVSVPLIVIGSEVLKGYNGLNIDRALGFDVGMDGNWWKR